MKTYSFNNSALQALSHIPRKVGHDVQRRIDALKIGQKMQDLPEELWHDSFRFYVKEDPTRVGGPNLRMIRLDPAKPSLTVTGYIFNKFVHPHENRFITPREAARLQGFPDSFRFLGTLTSVQMQVGNAVPVPLAQAVAQAVLEHAASYKPLGLGREYYTDGVFPVISLFSGAGGLDIGLSNAKAQRAHWRVKACVEFNADCCSTLRANFGNETRIIQSDIRLLQPANIMAECALAGKPLPLLVGGPPCQAFSQAGKQKGTSDPRGQMIFEFLRFVEEIRPIYFIMENVSGLRSVEQGLLLKQILKEMERIGYNVTPGLLCAADYGAAQLRRRLLFLGVQKPLPPVTLPFPTHSNVEGLVLHKPYVGVGEAFADLPRLCPSVVMPGGVEKREKPGPLVPASGVVRERKGHRKPKLRVMKSAKLRYKMKRSRRRAAS